MVKRILGIWLCLVVLAGCSRCIVLRSEYFDVTGMVFTPKAEEEEVEIFADEVDRPYKEIGVVKVLAKVGTSREAINEEMKRRVRQAGADAIIEVQYGEDRSNEFSLCGIFGSTRRNISAVGKAIIFEGGPQDKGAEEEGAEDPTAERGADSKE